MRKSLLITAVLFASSPAIAQDRVAPMVPDADGNFLPDPTQEVPLGEDDLIAAFSGKTHRGTYTFERRDIDTFAFEETTSADGQTRHIHGDRVDLGTWRVRANVICFTYEDFDSGPPIHCFNIYQRGNCYYHYGVSSGSGGSFTARSVHDGEIPDCEPSMV